MKKNILFGGNRIKFPKKEGIGVFFLKSLKWKSRIATIIGMLATISAGSWAAILPAGYEQIAPFIVAILGIFVAMYSEELRVTRAEDLVVSEMDEA